MSENLERITGNLSIKRYFDTDYLGAYSLDDGAEPVLTIDSLWHGNLTLTGGRKEHHVIMKFKEKRVPGIEEVKPIILNATNRKTLKKLYGDDTAEVLEGKKVKLYVDPRVRDPQDGGFTEGLRIKPSIPRDEAPRNSSTPAPTCEECKKPIQPYGEITAEQIAERARRKYGKRLCVNCSAKHKIEQDKQAAVPEEPAPPEAPPAEPDVPGVPNDALDALKGL